MTPDVCLSARGNRRSIASTSSRSARTTTLLSDIACGRRVRGRLQNHPHRRVVAPLVALRPPGGFVRRYPQAAPRASARPDLAGSGESLVMAERVTTVRRARLRISVPARCAIVRHHVAGPSGLARLAIRTSAGQIAYSALRVVTQTRGVPSDASLPQPVRPGASPACGVRCTCWTFDEEQPPAAARDEAEHMRNKRLDDGAGPGFDRHDYSAHEPQRLTSLVTIRAAQSASE